jgi:hypothetical protein
VPANLAVLSEASGDPEQRTPADSQTVRNVFVIGPDKKIKLILVSDEEAGKLCLDGWKAPKPYIRIVPDPYESR